MTKVVTISDRTKAFLGGMVATLAGGAGLGYMNDNPIIVGLELIALGVGIGLLTLALFWHSRSNSLGILFWIPTGSAIACIGVGIYVLSRVRLFVF